MKTVKKIGALVLPAWIVSGVLGLLFWRYGLYPFGSKTISWCDMNQQVVPLLADFKDILAGRSGFFLSLANGSGMNFWGVFFFFLASPFSFLVLFVEKARLLAFMNVLTALKLACCAFTANLYFQKACRKEGLSAWVGVLLSLLYAFGGYGLLYYQNSIWLDEMYLFPLLLLSFEALLEKGRWAPYTAAVAAAVIVNYYIGYMVIVFTLLYFGLHFWEGRRRPETRQRAGQFLAASAAAALLSCVVWLPAFRQYLTSGRQSDILSGLASCNFLARLNTTLLVLLTMGSVFAVLLVSRVLGEKRRREYRVERILFFLLCVPIFLEPINRMWHTGSYMAFPTRYGFMTIFMGLCCALRVLPGVKALHFRPGLRAVLAVVGVILTVAFAGFVVWFWTSEGEYLTAYVSTLWGSNEAAAGLLLAFAAAVAVYGSLFLLYRAGLKRGLAIALSLVLILSEAYLNLQVYMIAAANETARYEDLMDLEDRAEEAGFWRIKSQRRLMDDNMEGAMGYHAVSHYTSLTSQEYMFLMKHLGYSSYWMKVSSYGGTRFSDALLAMRYQVESKGGDGPYVYENSRFALRRLDGAFPLGILYNGDLTEAQTQKERIPFQEAIFQALFGVGDPLFTAYGLTESYGCSLARENGQYSIQRLGQGQAVLRWSIAVEEKQTLYLDCFDGYSNRLNEVINGSFDVLVNGRSIVKGYPRQSQNGIQELGTFENERVEITLRVTKNVRCASFGVYGLNEAVLDRALNRGQGIDFQEEANGIIGRVNRTEPGQCLVTLPYDTGFTLRINGKKAEYSEVLGGFISFELPAGESEIELTCVSPGFYAGAAVSAAAAIGGVLWLLMRRRKKKALPTDGEGRVAWILSEAAAGLVIAAVYIFPLVWNLLHLFI